MVVQRHWLRRGACAAAAVMGVSGTAGCSGGGDAVADARAGADPLLSVRTAADVLAEAGTAKARTAMETAAGGTRVTIRGEGGYDFRRAMGRLRVVLPNDPAGSSGQQPITELLAPGALYMKDRGAGVPPDKWVRVDTAALTDGNLVTGGATDPAAAAELLRGARSATFVGYEELAGVRVAHYRGVTDIAHAARAASAHARGALTAAAKGFDQDAVSFDAYFDSEGRLRKVRHQFSFANQGRTVAVASTTLLYEFGAPVVVRLPDRRDIYAGRVRM